MKASYAFRILRCCGWGVLLGSCGIVMATIVAQAVRGPEGDQPIWPSNRMWEYVFRSLWMSACATVLAFIPALPVALALVRSRRAWQRRLMLTLTVMPLVTMPSIYGYAWMIMASQKNWLVAFFVGLFQVDSPGWEPLHASLALAAWLWPIPALVLASSFRHVGAGAFKLALVDATPPRAFLQCALPVMRGPLIAAAVAVFVLALLDSTIAPLTLATEIWPVEMVAIAGMAGPAERPAAFVFFHAWPVMALICVLVILAIPGIRQMASWADERGDVPKGGMASVSNWVWSITALVALCVAVLPLIIFASAMAAGRYGVIESFSMACRTASSSAPPSLIVAGCVSAGAIVAGLAVIDDRTWPLRSRLPGMSALALTLLVAVLPPPVIGTALVTFFSSATVSPPTSWNLYENTPITWVAAMLARFVFLPVCTVRILNSRVPRDIVAQARTDGASRIDTIRHAQLPFLWLPLVAASLMAGCLSLTEIVASGLVRPPAWLADGLAVRVDSQMHYGRHNVTIALSLLMLIPSIAVAAVAPWLMNMRSTRPSRGDS